MYMYIILYMCVYVYMYIHIYIYIYIYRLPIFQSHPSQVHIAAIQRTTNLTEPNLRDSKLHPKGKPTSTRRVFPPPLRLPVEPTKGISEIWFRESFRRWGVLRLRVRVRFT